MITANGTLDTVRDVELHAATEQADAIRQTANRGAEQILVQARAEAAAVIARRCAAAEHLAQLDERDRLAEARAEARGTVLRAQRAALIDVRTAAHRTVRDLVGDPRLERRLGRLAADARERLAPSGAVQVRAAADGGFVARAGTREIDYSLRAQVDRIVDAMASELERLWR